MLNYNLFKSTDLNKDSLVWDLSHYNINKLYIDCNNMNELEDHIDHLDIINRLIELLDFYAFCNRYPDCIAENISSEHVFDFFFKFDKFKKYLLISLCLKNQENFKPFKEIFDKMDAYFKTIFTKKIIKINKIEYNKKKLSIKLSSEKEYTYNDGITNLESTDSLLNIEKLFYDAFLENRCDDSRYAILLNIYLNDITDPIEQREKVMHRMLQNGLKLLSITYDNKQKCIVLNEGWTNKPFKNFVETLYSSTKKNLEDEDMRYKALLEQEALEKKSAKVKKKIYIILGVLTLCGLCVGGYVHRKKLISKRFASDKITKIKSVI